MENVSFKQSWTADEFIAGLKDGTINADELRKRGNEIKNARRAPIQPLSAEEKKQLAEAAEKLKARVAIQNGDVYVHRAPIQPLNAEEKKVLEESIKRLKSMIKK